MKYIKDLNISSNIVSWTFEDQNIQLEINDVFFAVENSNLVKIDSGKNYIENNVYYYEPDGSLKLHYNLKDGIVEWYHQNSKKQVSFRHIENVGFFPNKQQLFIIYNDTEQKLKGFTLDGKCIFEAGSPKDFKMLYLSETEESPIVVCAGKDNYTDEFGRFTYNFYIDIDNGNLTMGCLAY